MVRKSISDLKTQVIWIDSSLGINPLALSLHFLKAQGKRLPFQFANLSPSRCKDYGHLTVAALLCESVKLVAPDEKVYDLEEFSERLRILKRFNLLNLLSMSSGLLQNWGSKLQSLGQQAQFTAYLCELLLRDEIEYLILEVDECSFNIAEKELIVAALSEYQQITQATTFLAGSDLDVWGEVASLFLERDERNRFKVSPCTHTPKNIIPLNITVNPRSEVAVTLSNEAQQKVDSALPLKKFG